MDASAKILNALRDVKGVEGSFYATRDGDVVARDMPRIYDGDPLDDVALRLARILDALADLEGTNDGALIRHPNHAIYVRGTPHGVLGVLATSDVNVTALRRGASLVSRRLPPPAPPPRMSDAAADAFVPPAPPPLPNDARASVIVPAAPPPARTSVPGAPATAAIRWRGTVKAR